MDKLTPTEASGLYRQLTGRELKRQHWQRWADRGDIEAEQVQVVTTRTLIPVSEVERVAREGLPHRGQGGRPKKKEIPMRIDLETLYGSGLKTTELPPQILEMCTCVCDGCTVKELTFLAKTGGIKRLIALMSRTLLAGVSTELTDEDPDSMEAQVEMRRLVEQLLVLRGEQPKVNTHRNLKDLRRRQTFLEIYADAPPLLSMERIEQAYTQEGLGRDSEVNHLLREAGEEDVNNPLADGDDVTMQMPCGDRYNGLTGKVMGCDEETRDYLVSVMMPSGKVEKVSMNVGYLFRAEDQYMPWVKKNGRVAKKRGGLVKD